MKYQIVEKDDYGTDWAMVRYSATAVARFDTEEEAMKVARDYLTDRNVNNSLTAAEKRNAVEAYMMDEKGCFLGVLDGKDWYLTDRHNEVVNKTTYYELEGKTQVAVRPVPGT